MPFPIDAPISGMRFAPKNSTMISSRIAISVKPRLPGMCAFLKERTGHEIREGDANEGEQRNIEPDWSERNRHHSKSRCNGPIVGVTDQVNTSFAGPSGR